MWRKTIPALLWLTALTLVFWILRQLPLADIARLMETLSLGQWLIWMGFNLGIIILATLRWRVFTTLLNVPVSFCRLLMIRQAGQAVSFMTPGPQFGGEPLQIFWLWQSGKPPVHRALLAVGLDRFYELWVNFSVLILAIALLLTTPATATLHWQKILLVLLLVFLTLSLFGWLMLHQPESVFSRLKQMTTRWQQHPLLQKLTTQGQQLRMDMRHIVAKHKPALFKALLLSLGGWLGLLAELALLLNFLGLPLGFSNFLVVLVSMRLAFLLPLPGGIGTLEAALFWAFQYLELPAEAAIGLIALMRLRDALILVVGICFLRGLRRDEA